MERSTAPLAPAVAHGARRGLYPDIEPAKFGWLPTGGRHEIYYEETTWKARPDFSPDGKRIVYSSYLGRVWNQIWVMPSQGGNPFPLSYGDFDNINPRWSPDGKQIAFISN